MFAKVSAYIGIRYARVNSGNQFISFINVFSVLGITLGLAALILVTSVMNGFESQLKRKVLSLAPHIIVAADTPPKHSQLPSQITNLKQWIELQTIIQSAASLQGVLLRGIEPAEYESSLVSTDFMVRGQLADLRPGEYGIVIGYQLANTLDVGLGDSLRVIVPGQVLYTPFGPVPKQRKMTVVGIYHSGSEVDSRLIYAHYQDARRLKRGASSSVPEYRLYLDDAFDVEPVVAKLPPQLRVKETWQDRQGALFSAVKMEKNMMTLMLLLIIAVAAFNIVSSLVMVVTEKKSDIAILRTLGLSTSATMAVFICNGMFNGIKGSLLGVLFGLLITSQVNPLLIALELHILPLEDGQILPIVIDSATIMVMATLSLLFSFLATLYPAYAAARQEPAKALRYE